MPGKCGFTESQWNSGVAEAREILRQRAALRRTITYSELANELHSVTIGYHEPAMDYLLGDVSTDEFEGGRPLLSVIVVHKYRDQEPGNGFYELAEALDFDISDRQAFWVAELNRVFDYWCNSQAIA